MKPKKRVPVSVRNRVQKIISDRRQERDDIVLDDISRDLKQARKTYINAERECAIIDPDAIPAAYELALARSDRARVVMVNMLIRYWEHSESSRLDRMRSRIASQPGGIHYEGPKTSR